MSFEFKTPHLHHGKTMDPLEFHAKYNRLERKHRRVENALHRFSKTSPGVFDWP